MKKSPPMPAFTVEISVGGCDWQTVLRRIEETVSHVREHGPECRSVWGGAGTHGHVHIVQRSVTREQYEAELSQWLQEQKTTQEGGAHA